MDNDSLSLNFVLIITRYYIFMCAKYNKEIYFSQLQRLIRSKYTEQKLLYQTSNNCETFNMRWTQWKGILEDISEDI